jgi:mycofactocin precursor
MNPENEQAETVEQGEQAETVEQGEQAELVAEDLIEEVSIDGMCGVY